MKITLIGYENLGSKNSNLYHIAKKFEEKGWLEKVICSFNGGKLDNLKDKVKSQPRALNSMNYLLYLSWLNISRKIPERYFNEMIFDFFAKKNIPNETDSLFFTDSGFVRCVDKAKSKQIKCYMLHRTLHPEHIYRVLKEEEKRWGIKDDSIFTNKSWINYKIKSLQKSDGIIVLSTLASESCKNYGIQGTKIKIVKGSKVDLNYFRTTNEHIKKNEFTCLFMGHKSLIKGVPYLLEAWKQLDIKKSNLIVAGIQNRRLIDNYSKLNFSTVGSINNPLYFYNVSDIFILPSLADAFPRVVLEAMGCSLPVIVTEGVGAKDVIEDGKEGFIIPIRDAKAIKDSIRYFYDNPMEIKRMGRNARNKVEHYSKNNLGDNIVKIVEENKYGHE